MECCICYEDGSEGNFATAECCNSGYHHACLRRWLKQSRRCPYCQKEHTPTLYVPTLNEFDLNQLGDNDVVIVVGRRGSGKSILSRDIMCHKRHISRGAVFRPTEAFDPIFSDSGNPAFVHETFDETLLDNMIKEQRVRIHKDRQLGRDAVSNFLVLDDMATTHRGGEYSSLNHIFSNGHHEACFVLVTTQRFSSVKGSLLYGNCDYVFLFDTASVKEQEAFFEEYEGHFDGSLQEFKQLFKKYTKDHGCMVIKMTSFVTHRIEDRMWHYRARHDQSIHGMALSRLSSSFWLTPTI